MFSRFYSIQRRVTNGRTDKTVVSISHAALMWTHDRKVRHIVVVKIWRLTWRVIQNNIPDLVLVFTARCTLVQSAVLRSHVVCLSVTLVDCDHIGWNSSNIISPLVSLGCSLFATPTWRVCSKGNSPKFGLKVTHPLLIWTSETFDRKLRPNGYR